MAALQRAKDDEVPPFTMGPVAPPPQFREWSTEVENSQRYERYRIALQEVPVFSELIEFALKERAGQLEREHGENIYPLQVFVRKSESGARIEIVPTLLKEAQVPERPPSQFPSSHDEKEEQQTRPSRNRRDQNGKRKRSSGTSGPQRAKKWKLNQKKKKKANAQDPAGGRSGGPGHAGP